MGVTRNTFACCRLLLLVHTIAQALLCAWRLPARFG